MNGHKNLTILQNDVVGGGEGPDFGRRMSLSSLGGGRKYGRASESRLPVRHIPIVMEEAESDSEAASQHSGTTRLITRGSINVPINYSWSIVYSDR